MGICSSCESTTVATAKLIMDDGGLQEFTCPVKASYVLQANPAYFICNSDEMEFGDVVSPVSDDEELQPGQLYFALPLSRLRRRLRAEEMAALAVKATAALARCGCRSNSLVFPGDGGGMGKASAAAGSGGRTGGGAGRRGKKLARLSSIAE
ncbi:plastid movement impaired 2 [Striga asiatica]|uniref:Plastid movement impaired 2 n=1 Tax=Striga asiatica TaxID=4170 RepID=A0A5A7PTV2_STRAF|nr:plastid movement impaired 2 [Striga asiatica]